LHPAFSITLLVPLAILVLAWAGFGSWRASTGAAPATRWLLVSIRVLAVAAVFGILFNPGKWVRPSSETKRPWVILNDASASMNQATASGSTRAAVASELIQQAKSHTTAAGIPLRIHDFAESLSAPLADAAPPSHPKGPSTRILHAVSQSLQQASAAGESLAGIIVPSDGRQTLHFSQAELDAIGLRARSANIPVHTVTIGADTTPPDLALIQPRAAVTAFAGQPLRIPFALRSDGLDPIRPTVILRDAADQEIASLTLEVPTGKTVSAAFEVTAPTESTRWSLDTPVIDGEVRPANNRAQLHLRILDSRTRVFIAEGAPYWDSKFLAQLLRQQPHMDVQSVHRLSDERYFRIDSGVSGTSETQSAVFPASLEELTRYDLIVFGKNIDPFITPSHAAALRSYVRDHGGAVLFARGKPSTASLPDLEPLEPVEWGNASTSDFRFAPTADGESAGLFGQALPAPDASLWKSLPNLKDGRQITLVKPFTRILAEGLPDRSGNMLASTPTSPASGRFPALLVRRYGQGVTGVVNGDGLWKWDFFPEARELGNCYEDFWIQLIQWMSSYSEFLPGQDFSLRLPANRGEPGVTTSAAISYRGPTPVPQPLLLATDPAGTETRIQPAAIQDPSGRPSWRASFTPESHGTWKLQIIDPRDQPPPAPETLFTVPAPPAESDDLSPNPEFLTALSQATGGQSIQPKDFPAFLKSELSPTPPASQESGAIWQSSWNHPLIALLIAALLATEWFIRRRHGMA
jgi:hypothetical protein